MKKWKRLAMKVCHKNMSVERISLKKCSTNNAAKEEINILSISKIAKYWYSTLDVD